MTSSVATDALSPIHWLTLRLQPDLIMIKQRGGEE
jgi:hypothetical protein